MKRSPKKKPPLAVVSCDKEIIELAMETGARVVGAFDTNPDADAHGVKHLGPDARWAEAQKAYPGLKVALALDPPKVKQKAARHYGLPSLASLVSRDAYVSKTAALGAGCVIQRGVKIFAKASVGAACKINVNAVVHHDSRVGDFCTLAPGCQILGAVTVGDRVFVGAGAILLPKVRVGADAVIGAGAVVTKDVPAGAVVKGVPAR